MVSLHPQWDRVLGNDSVTLTCQGAHPPGDNSTQWFHNGSSLSNQTSSYVIAAARAEDSGEYRCRTGLSGLSDPVRLEVHAGEWAEGKGAPAPRAVADGRPREPRGEPETTLRGGHQAEGLCGQRSARAVARAAVWPQAGSEAGTGAARPIAGTAFTESTAHTGRAVPRSGRDAEAR